MPTTSGKHDEAIAVLFPTGMLGGGFPPETITRGLALGADAIAVDAGSTDSGPHYLGTGTAKTTDAAVRTDLEVLLPAAIEAGIPLVVTSCGTSGTDAGVDRMAAMVDAIAARRGLAFTRAAIYSEQDRTTVLGAMAAGRLRPLPPERHLDEETVRRCTHIVGLMGREPISAALDHGAQVVLAGRATDTASVAALALRRGLPPGAAWHAAKTVECGGLCTTAPRSGGVLVRIASDGFTVEPLSEDAACTPTSVAAHLIYENADPFLLTEPGGVLDTSTARYEAVDARTVKVTGSRFRPAGTYTVKLEGAAPAGFETISLVGIRDPEVVGRITEWTGLVTATLTERAEALLGLSRDDYQVRLRAYGANAILGELDPDTSPVREVAVLLQVRARDQDTANALAKIANPLLLHAPLPGMEQLPSFAFPFSPAEVERGEVHEFVLNHVIETGSPTELFRTEIVEVGRAR